jgi:hypothetical protein
MASRRVSGSAIIAGMATAMLLCLLSGPSLADDGQGPGPSPGGPPSPPAGFGGGQPAPGAPGPPGPTGPPTGQSHGSRSEGDHHGPVPDARSRVFKSVDAENDPPRRRAGWLDYNDALKARSAGQIISLKQAIDATHSPGSKVIEVKLFGNGNQAVYRIKLMDRDGTIRTVRINAVTAQPGGLF